MAADSSPNSPVASSTVDGDGDGAPYRRSRLPWAQVVRGGELDSTSSDTPTVGVHVSSSSSPWTSTSTVVPEKTSSTHASSEKVSPEKSPETQRDNSDRNNGNAAGSKKPAWNKPLNGVVESSSIMGGAVSWPALSESTRPTPKSTLDASKHNSEGSASTSQGPIISQIPQRQINTNANANSTSTTNHGVPRQRSMRHRGSTSGNASGPTGGSAHVGYNRSPPPPPPLPPAFPAMELSPYGNFGNFVAPILDTPVRGVRPMGGLGSLPGNDHSLQPQRSSSRRSSFGPRPRGDGQHFHNNGGRRDNDRRDAHVPHQFIPPGPYIPPLPPGSASFIAPPNMRPFMTPLSYDMGSPYVFVPTLGPEPFRGMPLIAQTPAAPMYFPSVDLHLPNMIVRQIDYYFSDANLVKDDYLRSNMDEEGWVSINLIAGFPRVQNLTTDIQLILESLRASAVVEVEGDKIRRRNEWNKWVHTSTQTSDDSGSQPLAVSSDSLPASVEGMTLNVQNTSTRGTEDMVNSREEIVQDKLLPGEASTQAIVDKEELTDEDVHPTQI